MKKIIISIIVALGFTGILFGQQANTMYFMKSNSLRHTLNPAFQPEYRIYIGLPGFSSFDFSVGNNSLVFSDIYRGRTIDGKKETVSFLHPDEENGVDDFLDAYRKNLRAYSNFELSLLTFGFRINRSYFTFDISNKAEMNIIIPKGIPNAFFKGVEYENDATAIDLNNLSMNASVYTELALGYSYNINEQWTVGGKLKFLYGHANLYSDFQNLTLDMNKERWLLSGSGSLYGAAPGLSFEQKEDGTFDGVDFDDNIDYIEFTKPSGLGLGADFGAAYNLLENLQFSASIVDLGFIRWNENICKANKENNFEFDGIVYDMNNDSIDYWDEYEETLKNMFYVDDRCNNYTTYLTAKVYIGAEYSILNDKIGFGLLSKSYITGKKMFEELVMSANFRPCNPFSASFSYSLLDGKWSNLGFGLNLNAGPVNFFLNADNIPLVYAKGDDFWAPTNTKAVNISLGFNFVFGKERKEKRVVPEMSDIEPVVFDADEDGIPDDQDICEDTPRDIEIGEDGCPKDTDEDGVPDYLDRCPDTPVGARGFVNQYGCLIDTDNDGICDYLDHCPETPSEVGSYVDEYGCTADTDGDGVPDYLDQCPDTPAEAYGMVDEYGCPLDKDNDSIPDYLDRCPEIPGLKENGGCPGITEAQKTLLSEILYGIKFKAGEAVILDKQSYPLLDSVAAMMLANPYYHLQVEVYLNSDKKKDENYNYFISKCRAMEIQNYLVNKGIEKNNISIEGKGFDNSESDMESSLVRRNKNGKVVMKVNMMDMENKEE